MKRLFKLCYVLIFSVSLAPSISAQYSEPAPLLNVDNSFWGVTYNYTIDGTSTSRADFYQELQKYPNAYSDFKSGKSLSDFGKILSNVGSFAFGFGVGRKVVGEDVSTTYLLSTGGVAVLGIILDKSGLSKMKQSLYKTNGYSTSVTPILTRDYIACGLTLRF